MKNLESLINKSVLNKVKVEETLGHVEKLSDKIKKADSVVNDINNMQQIKPHRKQIKNVTFALVEEDVELIENHIRRYRQINGDHITKSLIIRTALNLITKLNDNEFVENVALINTVERGRPKNS